MMSESLVAVTSRSFSKNRVLREKLLTRYKNVKFNDAGQQLSGASLIEFLSGCEKAIIGLEKFDEAILQCLPELKVLSRFGVGLDTLNMEAMIKHGVRLGWSPGLNKRAISELVIAFAIALLRKIPMLNAEVKNGKWRQVLGRQLSNSKVGIIGFGAIGRDVARLLKIFGSEVVAFDNVCPTEIFAELDVTPSNLDELLATSDVVTIHLPLTKQTKNMLNAKRLMLLRPNAILINTARGELVDEVKLKEMLEQNQLAGAGFDVFANEPPQDMELLKLPHFLATPHIGGSTEEAVLTMGLAAIEGLESADLPNAVLGRYSNDK